MNEDWVIVKNFIDKNTADLLYGYVLLADKRLKVLNDVDPQIRELPNDEPTVYGRFGDEMQITNDYCQYGDLIFDALLLGKA